MRALNLFLKRLIDLFGSLIGLIILSPFLLIIAFAIKLTSKGPILFKQERLGRNGKVFKILKFRTMVVNAENIGDGLTVKSESDNRITKVGRILRKTSLDELPQLLNVLVGEMSLVGPRPPVPHHPYEYMKYPSWAKSRFKMKPGITGLSQVKVRASVNWDTRIKYDVQYIEKFNLFLDFKILYKTVLKMFRSENIYLEEDRNQVLVNIEEGEK